MRRLRSRMAQATFESIFGMCMIVLMGYSVLKVSSWAGENMVQVQEDHENKLFNGGAPLDQVDKYFYKPPKIDGAWIGF